MYQYCNCKYVLNRVVLCVMISKKIFHEKIAEKKCYGSHGLVVMGGVSCSEGRGFEKEAGDGPFKKRFTEGAPED